MNDIIQVGDRITFYDGGMGLVTKDHNLNDVILMSNNTGRIALIPINHWDDQNVYIGPVSYWQQSKDMIIVHNETRSYAILDSAEISIASNANSYYWKIRWEKPYDTTVAESSSDEYEQYYTF